VDFVRAENDDRCETGRRAVDARESAYGADHVEQWGQRDLVHSGALLRRVRETATRLGL
jgi:hypothetical protein